MKRLAAVVAIIAALAWLYLCWRGIAGPESDTAARARTLCFLVMIAAGSLASVRKR